MLSRVVIHLYFCKLLWSLFVKVWIFLSKLNWKTAVQLKGMLYFFSLLYGGQVLWRRILEEHCSPLPAVGLHWRASVLGSGSTICLLVFWVAVEFGHNQLLWCHLPSLWKSFLCKQQRSAWVFTAPTSATSGEFISTIMFAGGPKLAQERSINLRMILPGL